MILFIRCRNPTLKCHLWNTPKMPYFSAWKMCFMLALPEKGLQVDCITTNNLDSLS